MTVPSGPAARALRAAGYVPLPRLWVTREDLALVLYMADQHADEVNRIRGEANGTAPGDETGG